MATYSQYLGLKLNASTDPFELSDFVNNWDIIDASPGVYVCTSANRPSWGSSQNGRIIFMQDLKQLSYWDGSSWNDLRDSSAVFSSSVYLETWMAAGTSPTFSVCTFTTPRPCSLAIVLTGTYQVLSNATQEVWQYVTVDGTYSGISGNAYVDRNLLVGQNGQQDHITTTSLGLVASLSSGTHTIGVQAQVQKLTSAGVQIKGARCIAFIGLYSSTNTL